MSTPVVPGAPTGVTAVAGLNSATVSWTAPASNGGSPITGYVVTPSSGSPIALGNVLTVTFRHLTSGTPISFTVVAKNLIGNSPASSPSSSVTPTAPTVGPPSAVLGVTGVAGVASATISWTPPISNGGSPITGYKVICVPDNKKPNLAAADATSLVVTNIKNTVKTLYTVVALNGFGQSNSVTLTPNLLSSVPKVTAVRGASGVINLDWAAKAANEGSPIAGYLVSVVSPVDVPQTMVLPPPTLTATGGFVSVSGLTNGTPYVFSVQSVSDIGPSAVGLSKALVPARRPDMPTAFAGTKALKSVGLTWAAPTNTGGLPLTGYTISYTVAGVAKVLSVKLVTTAVVKSLVDGTPYTFVIRANNLIGSSDATAPVTVTPGP